MDFDMNQVLKSIISGSAVLLKNAIKSKSFTVNASVLDASSGNETKWTLLHAAAFHNNLEAAQVLLEAGADVDCQDSVFLGVGFS